MKGQQKHQAAIQIKRGHYTGFGRLTDKKEQNIRIFSNTSQHVFMGSDKGRHVSM